jgi:hypothetical protein
VSGKLTIPAQESRVTRLFAINLPEAQVAAMLRDQTDRTVSATGELPETPAAAALLGWPDLDTRQTELFAVRDLTGLGLPGYLVEGLGLPEEQINADKARLSALEGYVLIVLSRAFGGQDIDLELPAEVTLIGTYRERSAPVQFEPLPSAAARGTLTGAPAPQPAGQNRRLLRVAALTALLLIVLGIGALAILGGNAQ